MAVAIPKNSRLAFQFSLNFKLPEGNNFTICLGDTVT